MSANSGQIQASVMQAAKIMADRQIDGLKLDKTIQGSVIRGLGDNCYSIQYNGGVIRAYATDEVQYLPNSSVYILVPQGNFDKKKTIIGLTSNTRESGNLTTVSSALDGYAVIGNNILYETDAADAYSGDKKGSDYPFGVNSYRSSIITKDENEEDIEYKDYQECKILYQSESSEETNWLGVNNADLLTYIQEAKAFMFSADFKAILPLEQIYNGVGDYGLILTVKIKNPNKIYGSIQEEWDDLEKDTRQIQYKDGVPDKVLSLNYYKDEVEKLFEDETLSVNELKNKISVKAEEIKDFRIQQLQGKKDQSVIDFVELYETFLQQLIQYSKDDDGNEITADKLKGIYDNWFSSTTSTAAQYSTLVYQYNLNTAHMTGDPYKSSKYSRQYIIQEIDPEIFMGITGIYFFCNGFYPTDNLKANDSGNNIFVKNIQFHCLKEAGSENSDYRLELEFPQGARFTSRSSGDSRRVNAKITYQKTQDFSNRCSILWFKRNTAIISSEDPLYNHWAGIGWEKLTIKEKGLESFARNFYASDNKAYQNEYLCIATYNLETILKQEFILYNDANKRDYQIVSDSGTAFGYGGNSKILTCLINGVEENFDSNFADDHFRFEWSKTTNGQTTIFNKTQEQLQETIDTTTDYSLKSSAKMQLAQTKGISWDFNTLTYPSSQISINQKVEINCKIWMTDDNEVNEESDWYIVGSASIILTQGEVAALKGYYIDIVNGDQVFQYTEAGISPCSERFEKPYELQTLSCNFYSPAGGLVTADKYKVKWQWPLSNTLLVIDEDLAITNVGTGLNDLYEQQTCPIAIAEDYDYSAINNQITCIIEFDGATYYKDTSFYFGKIGDNGTNGTDTIATIVPCLETTNSTLQSEPLTIIWDSLNDVPELRCRWNTGDLLETPALKLQLWKRNELVDAGEYKSIKWSIAGPAVYKSRMSVSSSILDDSTDVVAIVRYAHENKEQDCPYHNYIVKGQASLPIETIQGEVLQNYYYYYPIPVIYQKQVTKDLGYSIGIDKSSLLRQVLYNNDGRSPQYAKNNGVKLLFKYLDDTTTLPKKIIKWSVGGGYGLTDENGKITENQSNIRLISPEDGSVVDSCKTYYYDTKDIQKQIEAKLEEKKSLQDSWAVDVQGYEKDWVDLEKDKNIIANTYREAKIKHQEALQKIEDYLTALTVDNQTFIKVMPLDVYEGATCNNFVKAEVYNEDEKTLEYEIWVPIHLSLNTYGLTSLNGWDGNSVEIQEDKKYVMAPQIGAGVKNVEDNSFTGIVMGKEVNYSDTKAEVGLMGYSHGKKSIFLDAETGSATFGLPEDDAINAGNPLTEGRIELNPGGESRISRWRFDSRSLYRVVSDQQTDGLEKGLDRNRIHTEASFGRGKNNEGLGKPYETYSGDIKSKAAPISAHGSIPHDQQGMLISAAPAYLSVKGKPLTTKNSDIQFNNAETAIKPGDAFEVEIDPNSRNLFSIYRHVNPENSDSSKWYRKPVVYIDEQGSFSVNALRDHDAKNRIGLIGAFGNTVADEKYIGMTLNFDDSNKTGLFKYFTDNPGSISETSSLNDTTPLYISTHMRLSDTDKGDEGTRPIGIYGGDYINLYSGDNDNSPTPETNITRLSLNHKEHQILLGTTTSTEDKGKIDGNVFNDWAKSELLLKHGDIDSAGHLVHSGVWRTKIGRGYQGYFNADYTQTIKQTVSRTYDGKSTINANRGSEHNVKNGNFTLSYKVDKENGEEGTKQEIQMTDDKFSFTQYGNKKIESNSDNGILIFNNISTSDDSNGIQLVRSTYPGKQFSDYMEGTKTKPGRNIPKSCGILLSSIGNNKGIGLYTEASATQEEGYESASYVSFRMEPAGTDSAFYLNAVGSSATIFPKDKEGIVHEETIEATGSYIQSYYPRTPDTGALQAPQNNAEGSIDYPLFGVKIGPTLFTHSAWINGCLGLAKIKDKDWGTWVDRTGLLVEQDIRSSQNIVAKEELHFQKLTKSDIVNGDANDNKKTYEDTNVGNHISNLYDLVSGARTRANNAHTDLDDFKKTYNQHTHTATLTSLSGTVSSPFKTVATNLGVSTDKLNSSGALSTFRVNGGTSGSITDSTPNKCLETISSIINTHGVVCAAAGKWVNITISCDNIWLDNIDDKNVELSFSQEDVTSYSIDCSAPSPQV